MFEPGSVQFWGHGRLAPWLCWLWEHRENTEAESPPPIPGTVLLVCLGQPGALLLSQLWFCHADLFSFCDISCRSGHLQEGPVTSSCPGGQEGLAGTQQRGGEGAVPSSPSHCQGCDSPRAPGKIQP